MKHMVILIALFINIGAAAQNTIADYLSVPFPTNLKSNNHNTAVAWVFNSQGVRNIWYAAAPDYAAVQLTTFSEDDGLEITDLQFATTDSVLLFVRGNGTNSRGEPANPAQLQTDAGKTIYSIGIDGNGLKQLAKGAAPLPAPDGKTVLYLQAGQVWQTSIADSSRPKKLFTARGGISSLRWSPGGAYLAFISQRSDHALLGIYNPAQQALTYPDPSVDHQGNPVWSPDGRSIAYTVVPNRKHAFPFVAVRTANPWGIRIYDLETKTAQTAWAATPGKGSVFVDDLPAVEQKLIWTKEGHIVFPYEGNGWVQLYALNPQTKKVTLLTLGTGEVEGLQLAPDGAMVYYTSNIGDIDRRHISWVNNSTASTYKSNGIEWSPQPQADGSVIGFQSSATSPAWPVRLQNNKLQTLAPQAFPQQFPKTLVTPRVVSIKAKDGITTTATLFLPPHHNTSKKHPAVVYLHGGSRRQMLAGFHYSQYYSHAYALNQYLAAQGFVVLSLNYRSGIGYGLNFREADNYGFSGASEVQDLIAAGEWLRARPDVDSKKIGLWGGSYGGYLTAHGLSQAPHLFSYGVDIHGVHNWNDELPTFAPWYDASKFPKEAAIGYRASPMAYVKNWKAPVLLIHGDDDRNVPFSESVNIAQVLRAQGVPVEHLVLPDEVHSFLLHRNWLKIYEATAAFLQRQSGVKN